MLELLNGQRRLSPNDFERRSAMKLIYSLFLLASFGLLVNIIPSFLHQPLFTASEMREVHRRLNSIGNR
jgi:hypothetical protein